MGMKLVESLFLRIQILMAIIDYFCGETLAEVFEEVVSLGRRSWDLHSLELIISSNDLLGPRELLSS